MTRAKFRLRKELLVAAALLSFGLAALPVLVYWVGSRVVGEYYPDSGLSDFVWHIWSDLAAGSVLAWILIVSPYLIIQLLRLALILWRRRPDVSSVTVSDVNQ
jgi:hypothetical protein